jgi:putative membrane protein insertion efficiency factor
MGTFEKTMSISKAETPSHTQKTPLLAWPAIGVVRMYQLFVSPLLGQNCRFYPSCSCYAHEALKTHGLAKGSLLAIKRIGKCHPLHPGGIDMVPKRTSKTTHKHHQKD